LPPSTRRRDAVRQFEHLPRLVAEVANTTGAYFVKRKITAPSQAALDDVAAGQLWEARKTLAGFRSQQDREAG
jgi:hypothetical protein